MKTVILNKYGNILESYLEAGPRPWRRFANPTNLWTTTTQVAGVVAKIENLT